MPCSLVFPGGVIEKGDSSRNWLALYESLGVPFNALTKVTQVNGERPPIFQYKPSDDELKRYALSIVVVKHYLIDRIVGIYPCAFHVFVKHLKNLVYLYVEIKQTYKIKTFHQSLHLLKLSIMLESGKKR